MDRVGAYEAKTHLSKLLDRVAEGESITIERYGKPVAVLGPADEVEKMPFQQLKAEIESIRKGIRLDGLTIKELVEEGRKW